MKDENINSIYRSLAGTDLTIEDTSKFLEFVSQTGLGVEEATQNIKVAKEKADKKVDYSEFERKLVDYFKNIQTEINKDGLFQYSDEKDIEEFRKFFQEIVDKNIIIYKLKDDKDECQRKLTEIENIKNEISSLNKTTSSISSDDLKRINDLNFKLGVKNLEYKKVLDLIEEDVKIITKNSKKQEFIGLVSSLTKDLNELTIIMDRLSLTSRTKTSVQKLFTSLIDELTEMNNLHTKEIKEFTNLCLAAGITGPSLQKEDIVIYNGSKPLFGNDYTSLLEEGKEYKVNRSIFKNNGLEEFYIEGFDKPFSVSLFDTPNEWQEKQVALNKNKEIVESNPTEITNEPKLTNTNIILNASKDDEIKLNERIPFKIDLVDDEENKHINDNLVSNTNKEGVEPIINHENNEGAISIDELMSSNGELTPALKKGDFVVYNGSKDYISTKDNTNLLQKGFSYKVTNSIINDKGEEEIYLEGFDEPFSVILFETEEIWKEHMNGLITQMVTKVDTKSINKEEAYTNAVIGLSKKNVSFNLKRAIATLLRKAKDNIDKLKESLSSKLRPDFESKYISDFMAIDADYEELDDDIIDMNEFSKSFDEIKKEESKSKKR